MSDKPTNFFAHIELNTQDPAAAKTFYSALFPDWQWQDMPTGGGHDYTVIKTSQGAGGGLMKHPMPGAPSFWCSYVQVADVKAAYNQALSLGGKSVKEPTDVGVGWIALFIDPTGAVLGLWQPAPHSAA